MEDEVEFRISKLGPRVASTRDMLSFSEVDGADVVIRCPPGTGASLNEKLVWLWGLLQLNRRKLKALQAEGACLSCVCVTSHDTIVLQPNAAEFLHLVGASLTITTRP